MSYDELDHGKAVECATCAKGALDEAIGELTKLVRDPSAAMKFTEHQVQAMKVALQHAKNSRSAMQIELEAKIETPAAPAPAPKEPESAPEAPEKAAAGTEKAAAVTEEPAAVAGEAGPAGR